MLRRTTEADRFPLEFTRVEIIYFFPMCKLFLPEGKLFHIRKEKAISPLP